MNTVGSSVLCISPPPVYAYFYAILQPFGWILPIESEENPSQNTLLYSREKEQRARRNLCAPPCSDSRT